MGTSEGAAAVVAGGGGAASGVGEWGAAALAGAPDSGVPAPDIDTSEDGGREVDTPLPAPQTDGEITVADLIARLEAQARNAAAERMSLEALLSTAQAEAASSAAEAAAASARASQLEGGHAKIIASLRSDLNEQLASLRADLRRLANEGSVMSDEVASVVFYAWPEDELDNKDAGDPSAAGLTPAQRQKLILHGVTKVGLNASGGINAANLARLLTATRDFALRRKGMGLEGHFPQDIVSSSYFTEEAASYVYSLARLRSRAGPPASEIPTGSAAWYRWLRGYLRDSGPDVGPCLADVPPYYVAADKEHVRQVDIADGLGLYLEGVEIALMSANKESLAKATARGIVVSTVLSALPSHLSNRVRMRYRMTPERSSVPQTLTWLNFRADVVSVLQTMLSELSGHGHSLADVGNMLRAFAVAKGKQGSDGKGTSDGKGDGKWGGGSPSGTPRGKGDTRVKDKGKGGAVTCYGCGEPGHRRPDCPNGKAKGPGPTATPSILKKSEKAAEANRIWASAGKGVAVSVSNIEAEEEGAGAGGDREVAAFARPPSCYNCRKEGHRVTECTEPVICHNCRKPGHMGKDCPLRRAEGDRRASASRHGKT